MNNLKVCFVGVGSIARRHIKNLRALCEKRGIALHIDALRRSRGTEPAEGVDEEFFSEESLPMDYDAVFVTNPTSCHVETIKSLSDRTGYFFVEKPICYISQIPEAEMLCGDRAYRYYVACPLRYNPVISYIKKNVDASKVLSVRCISSSYLPDWRPGQDYRETYSAHKELGGGVSIDLIHEWDYITDLFGFPSSVKSIISKKSSLEIDSDDLAIYIAEYDDMAVELHLDYFGRKTVRRIEIITDEDTIIGDLVNNTVEYLVAGDKHSFSSDRDVYQTAELETFIDIISGAEENRNNLEHAVRVLKLTQGDE